MIVLRNKNFTSNAQLRNELSVAKAQGFGILIELIKIIEFYDVGQDNMRHWVSMITNKYFEEALRKDKFTITDCLVQFENPNNMNHALKHFRAGLRSIPMGKTFINLAFNEFNPGKEQFKKYSREYKNVLNTMQLNTDFYTRVMKYLALSFSGQINPKKVKFSDKIVDNLIVDYDSKEDSNVNLEGAKEILLDCIVSIKGYELYGIKNLRD